MGGIIMTKKLTICICCMLVSLRVMAAVLPIKGDNIYYKFNEQLNLNLSIEELLKKDKKQEVEAE